MSLSIENVWVAILAMAVVTYLTRSLPFLLPKDGKILNWFSGKDSALSALGPSLLAALAAVTIGPDLWHTARNQDLWGYMVGMMTTLLALKLSKNTGIAVILGTLAYWLAIGSANFI